MTWRLTSPGREYNRDEGVAIYFHPASGNTHLVSDLAASVLRVMAAGPLSNEDLVAFHAEALAEVGATERPGLIDEILRDLAIIDLVERS